MKKFSNNFWERILNGEDSYILKRIGEYRHDKEYTVFINDLLEKDNEG